ncbi:MAG: adenosylcobinamide-GDP ribazoletransferase [Sphingomonadales bacterium]|nr:adenosylcobinamide-GDP ribazoletransferase [Sphingomonadales bacterium]
MAGQTLRNLWDLFPQQPAQKTGRAARFLENRGAGLGRRRVEGSLAALAALAEAPHRAALALIAAAMISRLAPVMLLWLLPPARHDGMGRSASGAARPSVGVAALLCLPWLALPGLPVALIAAALVTLGLGRLARAKIGGQSGDVLGAGQQLAEIALLMGLCARIG